MTLSTACPKPQPESDEAKRDRRIASVRKLQASQTPIQRKRKLKAVCPSRSSVPRKTAVKKKNARRKASEFERCYLSKERVEFVKSLPCFASGVRGNIDNAHVARDGSEGMGRKGGYRCIAPLSREAHRLLHRNPTRFYNTFGAFDWSAAAAWTEREWQKFSGRATGGDE